MTSADPVITTLNVPSCLLLKSSGFSLDCGGSVFKIVYQTKEDHEAAKSQSFSKLRLVSFSKSCLDDAVSFIKQHAYINRAGDEPTLVYLTGVGGYQYKETLYKELNVRIDMVFELGSWVNGFYYITSKMSRNQILHHIEINAMDEPIAEITALMASLEKSKDPGNAAFSMDKSLGKRFRKSIERNANQSSSEPLAEEENIYPCILSVLGSGVGCVKVNSNGSFTCVQLNFKGGRAMYGLASLLTGCKSFEEFVELVSKGDDHSVHTYLSDLLQAMGGSTKKQDDDEYTIYSAVKALENDAILYYFGNAVEKSISDFRREDLARAIVNSFLFDFAEQAYTAAEKYGCQRVFFVGSVINTPLFRYLMTQQVSKMALMAYVFAHTDLTHVVFDYPIGGAHLAAIGAMMTGLDGLTPTN